MASTFQLEIVTPDRKFFEEPVEMVIVRTIEGDLGIMKDHMHVVSPLSIGIVKIKQNGTYREATCAGGFVQVGAEKTTIITDSAEWPEEIDVDRAKKAAERAEQRLKTKDGIDVLRAQMALERAMTRLRVTKRD